MLCTLNDMDVNVGNVIKFVFGIKIAGVLE